MQMAIRHNPEIHQFFQSIWQGEVTKMIVDLINEGKSLGYINKDLSQEALLLYFEIIRRGRLAISDLLTEMKPNAKFARDLNCIVLFGMVNEKE